MSTINARLNVIRGLVPLPVAERAQLDIRVVCTGGYLDFRGQTWQVKRVFRYLDVKWKDFSLRKSPYWITELELFSLNTGKTTYVEWEEDDKVEVHATTQLARLRNIHYQGQPIKFADLLEITEAEAGTVEFNGRRYYYSEDDTWAARFFDGDQLPSDDQLTGSATVRMFEFESDGDDYLTIEAWETDPAEKPEREAFVSEEVSLREFEILAVGG